MGIWDISIFCYILQYFTLHFITVIFQKSSDNDWEKNIFYIMFSGDPAVKSAVLIWGGDYDLKPQTKSNVTKISRLLYINVSNYNRPETRVSSLSHPDKRCMNVPTCTQILVTFVTSVLHTVIQLWAYMIAIQSTSNCLLYDFNMWLSSLSLSSLYLTNLEKNKSIFVALIISFWNINDSLSTLSHAEIQSKCLAVW